MCKSRAFGHKAASGLFVKKVLTTCSLLVKKPLTTGGLLAFVGGTLVKELLATIGLPALSSGFLVKMALAGCRLEAMALLLPLFVHGLFPVPVGGLLVSATYSKHLPSQWRRWEQPRSLLVFAQGATGPIVWGVADPVNNPGGSARRRLHPFVLQPVGGIMEGVQG